MKLLGWFISVDASRVRSTDIGEHLVRLADEIGKDCGYEYAPVGELYNVANELGWPKEQRHG